MSAARRQAIDRLYHLLNKLDDHYGPPRLLAQCASRSGWPEVGVYFFYEPGEVRESGESRVVRVGTHRLTATSQTTLWGRLGQHRGSSDGRGNHRGSIFRLHVGTALLASGEYQEAEQTWGVKRPPPGAKENEVRLERAVSRYIGAMPFRHVRVEDRFDRATIESGAIALLSNYDREPIDAASPEWLGHRADRADVKGSHLWNVRGVRDPWSETWLDVLETCVDGTFSDQRPGD